MRTCETFGCVPSLLDDVKYVHVRHFAVYPLFDMMFNTYMWDNLMFTLSLRWCSIHTCEPCGCSPSLWDDVQHVLVRHLAGHPLCKMMLNTYMRDIWLFIFTLKWCSIPTCETFGCSPSLWYDVEYIHVRQFDVYPLFEMVFNTYMRAIWLFTLSLRLCSIHTCEIFGCLPSFWDDVQYIHVRQFDVYPLFEMVFNTYMWAIWLFNLSLRLCSIHTCEIVCCLPCLWDNIQCVHVRYLAVYPHFEMTFNKYMWDILSWTHTFEMMFNTYVWDNLMFTISLT